MRRVVSRTIYLKRRGDCWGKILGEKRRRMASLCLGGENHQQSSTCRYSTRPIKLGLLPRQLLLYQDRRKQKTSTMANKGYRQARGGKNGQMSWRHLQKRPRISCLLSLPSSCDSVSQALGLPRLLPRRVIESLVPVGGIAFT